MRRELHRLPRRLQHGAGLAAMGTVEAKLKQRETPLRRIEIDDEAGAAIWTADDAGRHVVAVAQNLDVARRQILHEDLPAGGEQQRALAKDGGVGEECRAASVVIECTNQFGHEMPPPMCGWT